MLLYFTKLFFVIHAKQMPDKTLQNVSKGPSPGEGVATLLTFNDWNWWVVPGITTQVDNPN
jgi:hypothetical protein